MKPLFSTVVLTMAMASSHAATPVYREFGDWVVACDNSGRCEASGMRETGGGSIVLTRDAGADGHVELRLSTFATQVDAADLRVDNQALHPGLQHWRHVEDPDADHALVIDDIATVLAFIDLVRNGEALRYGDAAEDRVPLTGLSAALLLIDETQGRLGTRTALLRRGTVPDTRIPPATPLPIVKPWAPPRATLDATASERLTARIRTQQAKALQSAECMPPEDAPFFDSADMLTETDALVLIECSRGAYQGWSMMFRVPVAQPQRATRLVLELPFRLEPEPERYEMLVSASFVDGELHHVNKGRGMADCGESARWRWDGKAFVLVEFNKLGSCRGGMPGDWPALWRTAEPH